MTEFNLYDVLGVDGIEAPKGFNFADSFTGDDSSLIVKIRASHAGYVNGNQCLYVPAGMRASAHTWTDRYMRPILVHHDEYTDPIGRVFNAEYVSEADDDAYPSKDPLGYMLVHGRILNKDAAQKVMDGRYSTVSVNFSAPYINCSICNEKLGPNEIQEHEHVRGKKYDGKRAYWIIDAFKYKEVSFVNKPADEYASLIGWQEDKEIKTTKIFPVQDYTANKTTSSKEGKNMIEFADTQMEYGEEELGLIQWLDEEMQKDEMGLLGDAKLTSAARKKLSASSFCGKEDKSFPVPDCAHVTAALRLLPRYKGPSSKDAIRKCVMAKAKKLGCGTSDVLCDPADKDLQDSVFALIKEDGDQGKLRMYPMDTKERLIDSMEVLSLDIFNETKDKKAAHTAMSARAKEYGIRVNSWDPESEDKITWESVSLSDAKLEDILDRSDVKQHMEKQLEGYVPQEEYDNLKKMEEGGIKEAFDSMSEQLKAVKAENSEIKDQLQAKTAEADAGTEERVAMLDQIKRITAEKAVYLRYILQKPDMSDVSTIEALNKKVDEMAEKDKSGVEMIISDMLDELLEKRKTQVKRRTLVHRDKNHTGTTPDVRKVFRLKSK